VKLDEVERVKDRHEDRLMELDFVQGVGIRQSEGQPVIAVYVDGARQGERGKIPQTLEDVPVVVEETEMFEAF
jgi:hypothetical protein